MLTPIAIAGSKKQILRARMKAVRADVALPNAPAQAAANFMSSIETRPGACVALYFPVKGELDTWPLAEALFADGLEVALPVVFGRRKPLIFRRYTEGQTLIKGRFGIDTPDETAPEVTPDIVVTPLLAFDREGRRLGYGGGFYDRTLEMLRNNRKTIAVGFAFASQEVDAVPTGPLDQRLDWVVTERAAFPAHG
ncbi:MAG: 5-formyltetrahydrofolate cyclo-ligase [Pseudomonadota bacterium]